MKRQDNQKNENVSFHADGIYIEGKPRVVLCSSVFYFRLPRAEWRDRLEKVKAAGYNCVDIYFPWNFHESEEGVWDFEDGKDIEAYLKLVAELGLWVIARPGPYICSEWDMGGLPAYLLSKNGIVLRDYNELYLSYVRKWYDKVMPFIVKYQIGKQGTVIAVQIENELDFYDCVQIEPYIASLRDYALSAGVTVPLVVCAGQCDIVRAGGLVDGVIPTMNFYPELQEKTLESRIHHYVDVFREQDLPFCVTETIPSHVILRRELGAGAKFVAPYNQVSGTNFGFTPSVNNWGFPLAFMPHDYNLKGMINPQGEFTHEYGEAYLFSGLLRAFEEELGTSRCLDEYELQINGDCLLSDSILRTLRLSGGGKLVPIANVGEKPGDVHFIYEGKSRPISSVLTIDPLTCPLLPVDIPLQVFGLDEEAGKLAYSTAEIVHIERDCDRSYVLCHTGNQAELALKLKDSVHMITDQMEHRREDGIDLFIATVGASAKAELIFENGKHLCFYVVSGDQAVEHLRKSSYPWDGAQDMEAAATSELIEENSGKLIHQLPEISFTKQSIPGMGSEIGTREQKVRKGCPSMEEMGYYRGYAWYEGTGMLPQEHKPLGYMIYSGMDVIHFYRDGKYLETYVGDGNHRFIREPEPDCSDRRTFGVRSEIWGHSNFSDSRLPSMDLRSKKGIHGLSEVISIKDITENWCYCKDEVPGDNVSLLSDQDNLRPLISFGVYNNPDQPQVGVYKKRIKLHPGCDSLVLELQELHSSAKVYANGSFVKVLQPFDTTVSLDHVCGKDEVEFSILFIQKTIQESLKIKLSLYEGKHIDGITVRGADEKQLADFMRFNQPLQNDKKKLVFPVTGLEPGEVAVLKGSFVAPVSARHSLKLKITGKDAKVLVLLNGIVLGRVWLASETIKPFFKGGDDSLLFLPESFLKEDNKLELLVEAMQGEPCIERLEFLPVKS